MIQTNASLMYFFYGASNVKKAGEVLTTKFPSAFCFCGGEHVVSLFFSDIAKIKLIKVCSYVRGLGKKN